MRDFKKVFEKGTNGGDMGRDKGMERDRMTHREQRDEKIEAGDPLDETKSITPETETHLGDRREKENRCREGMSKARDPWKEDNPGDLTLKLSPPNGAFPLFPFLIFPNLFSFCTPRP